MSETQRFFQAKPRQNYSPAYSIVKLEGDYEVTVAKMVPLSDKKDKNGNQKYKLEYETVKRPRGFLVETPLTRGGYHRNGTFHVDSIDKLEKLGLNNTEVPLVDSEGEVVGAVPLRLKKEKVNA